ncbi:cell division protein PerM [Nocardioides coralli]|uniref:cell division protein PerM n=1 Tax=Nocardioides coralli TaxID=2872154 RepID=UPI001CA44CA4|nr:DUF6350 family protein [Nocardioides coralli]QZY29888.1 DUF6350 family protein [Nocardioides coralli]
MTSLLSAPERAPEGWVDPRSRRPLALLSLAGGVAAAGSVLLTCLGLAVTGWFLTDAGAHGLPRDALRVGAHGWLMAHGSGVSVRGTLVTVVPLLVTVLSAWATWRIGQRVGQAVSGHGPDADQISDGERDWTVPVSTFWFTAGYVAVATVTLALAATPATQPSGPRTVAWSVALAVLAGGSAIAVGSGRAAIWSAMLPGNLRATAAACRAVLRSVLLAALVVFLTALLLDVATAVNVLASLQLGTGEAVVMALVAVLLVPNATVFSAAYLLGPGFTVGTQTLVSPTLVVTGPLPAVPLLAALPDSGAVPAWAVGLVAIPPVAAAVGAALAQRRRPTLRWEEGALRGCAGGVAAGLLLGWLATVAGGAAGPGRLQVVGPLSSDVLVHAITSLGIGGLVGGLVMTGWQRRAARAAA